MKNGSTPHVWTRDPAIEGDDATRAAAVEKVNAGKATVAELPLRNGRAPAIWQLRSLTCRGYADLSRVSISESLKAFGNKDVMTLAGRATFTELVDAFRRGVVGVEGATDERGGALALDFEDAPGGQRVLRMESVEAVFAAYRARLIGELGERVLELSEVGPTSGQV